jgi:hypothetical protein
MCRIRFMASQTLRVLLKGRRQGLLPEVNHSGERSAARLYMCAPRSVARLALQPTMAEGTTRVIWSCVFGVEYPGNAGIAMTSKTAVRSFGTESGIHMRRTIG